MIHFSEAAMCIVLLQDRASQVLGGGSRFVGAQAQKNFGELCRELAAPSLVGHGFEALLHAITFRRMSVIVSDNGPFLEAQVVVAVAARILP